MNTGHTDKTKLDSPCKFTLASKKVSHLLVLLLFVTDFNIPNLAYWTPLIRLMGNIHERMGGQGIHQMLCLRICVH